MAASAALVLSSCSNEIDEVSNLNSETGKKEIKVATYTPGMTRAYSDAFSTVSEAIKDSLEKNGFCLYASYGETSKTNLFGEEGTTVSYSSDDKTWIIAKKAYWPESESVDFRAVYPVDPDDTQIQQLNSDMLPIFPDGLTDIMVASATTTLDKSNEGTVNLDFNHILAQVAFAVKYDSEDEAGNNFKLNSLTLELPNSGNYDFAKNEVSIGEETQVVSFLASGISVFSESTNITATKMVIPCSNATLTIKYEYDLTSTGATCSEKTKVFENISLVAGSKNTFNIILSSSEKEIMVSASINGWATSEEDLSTEE